MDAVNSAHALREIAMSTHSVNIPPISASARDMLDRFALPIPEERRRLYYENGWWRRQTIVDDFLRVCRDDPGKTAVVSYRYDSDQAHYLTYASLATYVERTAAALLHLGVGCGDVVSVQLPNRWQFNVAALAIHRIGAILNPVIPIHREREVGYITALLKSKVFITIGMHRGFDYPRMLRGICAAGSSIRHRIICEGDPAADELSFEKDILGRPWEEEYRDALAAIRVDPDAISDLQFTSGTTGEPKGVGHTFNTQYARARTIFETLRFSSGDTVFMASTLAHSTGYVYGCITPAMVGMTAVYQDRWDPVRALDIIARENAVWSFASPTFMVDLLRAHREHRVDLPSFKYFISGGAKIPSALVHQADEELSVRLIAVWGMTENGAVTVTHLDEPVLAAAESDGKPCPWMELRVVDPETKADLPAGVDGELQVRGANQMLGYIHRPNLTAAAFDQGGWFDTGDIAQADDLGHIRITGRTKDLVIRGGENIPVAELEGALYEHPDISEVAIIAVPDERLGERACVVVVPKAGHSQLTLADINGHLEKLGISRSYWPERLEFIEAMPRTLSGKIQKFQLRRRFGGG